MDKKNMHQRTGKVIFAKDGRGGYTPKISIPITWLRDMGITDFERGIDLQYDEKNKMFFVLKEGRRKDINLMWDFEEDTEKLILRKKYDDGKSKLHHKYLKSKNLKIKGYKILKNFKKFWKGIDTYVKIC